MYDDDMPMDPDAGTFAPYPDPYGRHRRRLLREMEAAFRAKLRALAEGLGLAGEADDDDEAVVEIHPEDIPIVPIYPKSERDRMLREGWEEHERRKEERRPVPIPQSGLLMDAWPSDEDALPAPRPRSRRDHRHLNPR